MCKRYVRELANDLLKTMDGERAERVQLCVNLVESGLMSNHDAVRTLVMIMEEEA